MALPDKAFEMISSLGNGLLGGVSQLLTNRSNRNLAQETNKFNANEARLNREFQAQQAQIARDWQEEQYLKYSSPSAMVQQYRDAGINPALMFGGNIQGSTGSSPSPSGSSASGSAIPMESPNFSGIISDYLGLARLKSEIDNINADTQNKRAQAEKSLSDIELNKQSISESQSRISKTLEETKSEPIKRGLMVAQTILAQEEKKLKSNQSISISYDNLKKQFEQNYFDKFGFYPETNVTSAVLQMFGQGVAEIEYFGNKVSNFVKKLIK